MIVVINQSLIGLIVGSVTIFSFFIVVTLIFLHKRFRRAYLWETPTNTQSVTNSAPISRRSSSSCLINLQKSSQPCRSRSASFGEDLTSRLQILAAGTSYRSYASAAMPSSPKPKRSSLSANIRFPLITNISNSNKPSISYQLRYDSTTEVLFISILQLKDFVSNNHTQTTFVILYLLPNDDEQRQTRSTTDGIFNEHFQFSVKSDELFQRTVRLSIYAVDSVTRIRAILGHIFLPLNSFVKTNTTDRTFSTSILCEYLMKDLPMSSDQLGEIVVTTCFFKDENLLQIRLHEIHQLQIDPSKRTKLLKAYFSGQTSYLGHKHPWMNTSSFVIPSHNSFRIDQELNLLVYSKLFVSTTNDSVQCHLRLHLQSYKSLIHCHARWQHSLRSNLPQTLTVPLRIS